ncbi:MAG: RagB/SusD family nutrient uptake outer membrane protein [Candidatus Marinimicrobia bacterium]|nr:RagB/SusD family nutrient uptake outer membrane protein [Candidatus Neomarinimicrobiota bacterium]
MLNNNLIRFSVPFLFIMLLASSCTDLEETTFDLVTPDNFYNTEVELTAAVVPVYSSLAQAEWSDFIHLGAVSSDEIVIPTRGGDWDDGGIWRALQEHTWDATLGFVGAGWSGPYGGIARANSTLDNLGRAEQTDLVKTYIAEVRVLRALYYWWLMDLYGGVPIVTAAEADEEPPARNTRTEVFNFIVEQINLALPDLEVSHGTGGHGRITTGAANTLLATVYLNAAVYTGTAMWSQTLAAAEAVINSGEYNLLPTVMDVFSFDNEGVANTEYILVVPKLPLDGVQAFRHMATLHYNQHSASPWNGFSVLTDFYNSYDATDDRLDQILVGQQYVLFGATAGDSAFDRADPPAPLIFEVEFPLFDASEMDGPRILKWPIDPETSQWFSGSDYAIFRYSHVLLMKAEAEFNLSGGGLASLNMVHERAGLDAFTTISADNIYWERGHEFLWEGFRRTDQIRHGTFLDGYTLKETVSDDYRVLFPIPQSQMDANPNLVQNTGY